MTKLVECVPNFSEGRDRAILDDIGRAIEAVPDVRLLGVDPGAATNRTVFTFVGAPAAVEEAAFRAIAVAAERIDMRRHRGEHPRIGATDVCPFVPLEGCTMAECVEIARRLGRRVGDELEIPVYLYEEAASRPERRNLAAIRSGEYEGLAAKLADPAWKPDYGAARFNPRSGATVIGAREFLVAYNINLNTRDKRLAHDIALELREAGRALRGPDGEIRRDANGSALQKPGRFKYVKAVGWYIEEYGQAQVSINLTNTRATSIHEVFDAACREADARGLRVTGSELVGLVPREAILAAGRHYLRKQGRTAAVAESELVHVAVQSLGLDDLRPFVPAERIVEYCVRDPRAMRLRSLPLQGFADEVASVSPVPGGGSVAAACGALAAALVSMVVGLAPRPNESAWGELETLGQGAQAIKDQLLAAVDADAAAFDRVLAARRMPKAPETARAEREAAIRAATREAAETPLGVLRGAARAAEMAREAVRVGLPATRSDAGVAALCATTAAEGAYFNVLVNLDELRGPEDAEYAAATRAVAREALQAARAAADEVRRAVQGELDAGT